MVLRPMSNLLKKHSKCDRFLFSYAMKGLHHLYNEAQNCCLERFQSVGFQLSLIVFVSFNFLHQSLNGKKTHLLTYLDGMTLGSILLGSIVKLKISPSNNLDAHLFISFTNVFKRRTLAVAPSCSHGQGHVIRMSLRYIFFEQHPPLTNYNDNTTLQCIFFNYNYEAKLLYLGDILASDPFKHDTIFQNCENLKFYSS